MADSKILAPFILYYEGGFVNDKDDPGGATNKGVTLATFRQVFGDKKTVVDLKNITGAQWNLIFKKYYWDKCKADLIDNQSIANMLVDFAWHSGVSRAISFIQKIVGVDVDGLMGRVTIGAINGYYQGPAYIFNHLKTERKLYLMSLKNWKKYGSGWFDRVEHIKFGSLIYNKKEVKC